MLGGDGKEGRNTEEGVPTWLGGQRKLVKGALLSRGLGGRGRGDPALKGSSLDPSLACGAEWSRVGVGSERNRVPVLPVF